jgi:excisionase family DNA binding protein
VKKDQREDESPIDLHARPGLVTLADAARWLDVPERMVRRLVQERRIAFVKVGRYVRFSPEDLRAYRDANLHQPPSPTTQRWSQAGRIVPRR